MPEKGQMFFSRTNEYPVIHFQELFGNGYHAAGVPHSPFQRAYKNIQGSGQFQPETCVFIPSFLTLDAICFNSSTGTLIRSSPSGVSLEIV